MCGIAGYILKDVRKHPLETLDRLLKPIRSRGPDDEGICLIDRSKGHYKAYQTDGTAPAVALHLTPLVSTQALMAHDMALLQTRYSIIDLSGGGHQPFVSRDHSVIAVFNGEIYNYIELRRELEVLGVRFRTASDTEVLVEGYGVLKDKIWSRLNGFWAVALYDFRRKKMILCRDRIGVAPLYYRQTSHGLYFASLIKPLIDVEPSGISADEDVVRGFLRQGIKDHDGTTYYRQIRTLPCGTAVSFDLEHFTLREAVSRRFWSLPQHRWTIRDISLTEAIKRYREMFFDAVAIRLRADVKVACELSGGLDSSSVVAAAAELKASNITTYTAKVKDADEEPYARSLLKRYPVDYRVLTHAEEGFIDHYQEFLAVMEEPYDNPNAYTHHRMLRMMKSEGTSVVLTGAGGDEVLAGYESSFWPAVYRQWRAGGLRSRWRGDVYEFCRRFRTLPQAWRTLRHYAQVPFKRLGPQEAPLSCPPSEAVTITSADRHQARYRSMDFHQRALFHFEVALLPFYMRSSDHFTMGIPVEHRFPLLDYRLVEFGLSLPPEYLFKNGWTKYLLRKAMEPYLPAKILWRRVKMGFRFPFGVYLARHREIFEPFWRQVARRGLLEGGRDYDQSLREDPIGLWRVIVTGMWLNVEDKRSCG